VRRIVLDVIAQRGNVQRIFMRRVGLGFGDGVR
jgi:hypothetical protein